MRTIAIGDIHGCDVALRGLLEAVDPRPDDRLVFLGDYVDRGPNSAGVIDQLIEVSRRCQTVFVRGNHDWMMLLWCRGKVDAALWATIGGGDTLASYSAECPADIPPAHVEFLTNCVDFYENDSHIFVHGNYRAKQPLCETDLQVLLWCHLCWPLPKPHCSGKTVIVGHTPQTNGRVADFGHLVCIDTYCFGGGCLTAFDVERRRGLQVDHRGRVTSDWGGISPRGWLGWMTSRWSMTPASGPCRDAS